jgi:hypothetical protein
MIVPSGGAAVSASNGAQTAAATVTVPAASYYLTAAGGVSSVLAAFQTQLNDNVQGYPQNADAAAAAIGWGAWDAGYLLNEASGSPASTFGAPATLTPAGTPTYGNAGPRAGIDKAIGIDSNTDAFQFGNTYDVTAADDIAFAWVGYHAATPAFGGFISKYDGGPGTGYQLIFDGSGLLYWRNYVATVATDSIVSIPVGSWYVGIACIERSTGKMVVAVRTLAGVSTVPVLTTVAASSLSNGQILALGAAPWLAATTDAKVAALYVAHGAGACTGLTANISTALTNFANAVNAAWSVTLDSTTGRVAIANSFWPSSVAFTNSTLRDVFGFASDFDYPNTAALTQSAIGGGTYDFGFLCNEAAGSLAAAFGTPATLAPVVSPTYSHVGARGGNDKAVGFDAANDGFQGTTSTLNVSATNDMILAWVGRHTTAPGTEILFVKGNAGASRWTIYTSAGALVFECVTASGTTTSSVSLSGMTGHNYVALAIVDRGGGNKIRLAVQSLTTGTQVLGANSTGFAEAMSNADAFTVGSRGGGLGATSWKLSAFYGGVGLGYASGMAANISTYLSNFATQMKSQTSTKQARGLWLPNAPFDLVEGDAYQAPRASDKRDQETPGGQMLSLVGNYKYRHRSLFYQAVMNTQVWESYVAYSNASWEYFCNETQLGLGASWFKPGSPVQIYYLNAAGADTRVGQAANSGAGLTGWVIKGLDSVEPKRTLQSYTGLFRIDFPELVSNG